MCLRIHHQARFGYQKDQQFFQKVLIGLSYWYSTDTPQHCPPTLNPRVFILLGRAADTMKALPYRRCPETMRHVSKRPLLNGEFCRGLPASSPRRKRIRAKMGGWMQCGRLVRPRNKGQVAVHWKSIAVFQRLLHTRPQPGKRRRALRERNPPRNTRPQTHRNDGRGVRLQGRIPPCRSPHRIDRFAHALKNSCLKLAARPPQRARLLLASQRQPALARNPPPPARPRRRPRTPRAAGIPAPSAAAWHYKPTPRNVRCRPAPAGAFHIRCSKPLRP